MSFVSNVSLRGGKRFDLSQKVEDGLYDLSARFAAMVEKESSAFRYCVKDFFSDTSHAQPMYTCDTKLEVSNEDLAEFLVTGYNSNVERVVDRLVTILARTIENEVATYSEAMPGRALGLTFYPADSIHPHKVRVAYLFLSIVDGVATLQSETSFIVKEHKEQ